MYALLLALLLGSARAAAAQAQDVGSVTVNSTRGLAMALNNTAVSQIYLNDTLTLVGAEWPGVVSIADGRAVKLSGALQAQPQVYVSLNWANLTGIIWLAPSASLVFEGLEVRQHGMQRRRGARRDAGRRGHALSPTSRNAKPLPCYDLGTDNARARLRRGGRLCRPRRSSLPPA